MRYTVEITERLVKSFEVEAPNQDDALAQIKEAYYNEKIIVESDSWPMVDFKVSPVTEYKVEITETLQKVVRVEASTEEEAISLVKASYNEGGILLDSDNFIDVNFDVLP